MGHEHGHGRGAAPCAVATPPHPRQGRNRHNVQPRVLHTQRSRRTNILSRPTGPSELFTTLAMAMQAMTVDVGPTGTITACGGADSSREQSSKPAATPIPSAAQYMRTQWSQLPRSTWHGARCGWWTAGRGRVAVRTAPKRALTILCAHILTRRPLAINDKRHGPWAVSLSSMSGASWALMRCGTSSGVAALGAGADQPNRTRAAHSTVIWPSQTLGTPPN